jgi:hypothetical protein
MAALLQQRLLVVDHLGLVLEFLLFVGLGAIPLRSLVPVSQLRLVVVSRSHVGTGVGLLAGVSGLLRLGATAAGSMFHSLRRMDIQWGRRRLQFRVRPWSKLLHIL